jgi:hypothetical protein
VVSGGTAIVYVEQDGVYIVRHIVPTLDSASETITSPIFHEDGFDPGEEASLRIP